MRFKQIAIWSFRTACLGKMDTIRTERIRIGFQKQGKKQNKNKHDAVYYTETIKKISLNERTYFTIFSHI
jgi:hypothetical protein